MIATCVDLQGKIRVYARIRPMLPFEAAKGQKAVLESPDELSLHHMWKGAKREYNFDAVFMPDVPQEKVCWGRQQAYVRCCATNPEQLAYDEHETKL